MFCNHLFFFSYYYMYVINTLCTTPRHLHQWCFILLQCACLNTNNIVASVLLCEHTVLISKSSQGFIQRESFWGRGGTTRSKGHQFRITWAHSSALECEFIVAPLAFCNTSYFFCLYDPIQSNWAIAPPRRPLERGDTVVSCKLWPFNPMNAWLVTAKNVINDTFQLTLLTPSYLLWFWGGGGSSRKWVWLYILFYTTVLNLGGGGGSFPPPPPPPRMKPW